MSAHLESVQIEQTPGSPLASQSGESETSRGELRGREVEVKKEDTKRSKWLEGALSVASVTAKILLGILAAGVVSAGGIVGIFIIVTCPEMALVGGVIGIGYSLAMLVLLSLATSADD